MKILQNVKSTSTSLAVRKNEINPPNGYSRPRLALLDETDSGLDVDSLRQVAEELISYMTQINFVLITHYQRLLYSS